MNAKQEERLVVAWEGVARGIGEFNETLRTAISKQWPEPRKPGIATVSRVPSLEDKLKKETGNTDGPVADWLGEFDSEEELGPREREFIAAERAKQQLIARPKAHPKAKRSKV